MAMQTGTPATPLSPQVICSVFVEQYYHILHETPDQAHKFYQDTSRIGRTGSDGVMEYVTTLPEINKKILSMDFSKYLTEIETADALLSHNGGVIIVVTGSLTMSDGVCQRFTQTFFLAPQESGGYFVLNDILRLISERNQVNERTLKDGPVAQSVADPTPAVAVEHVTTDIVADVQVLNSGTTVETNPTANGTVENNVEPPVKVTKEAVKNISVAIAPSPAQKDIPKKTPVAASPPPAQKDVTKKTYASIVKVMKEGPPTPVVKSKPSPKPVTKPATKAVEGPEKSSAKAPETAPSATSVTKNKTSHEEQGYSIFVKSLPFNSTTQTVEEEFKKFGAIKPGGIQVRNNKIDQYCFGFVEFESQQAMQAAIQASPLFINELEVRIEQKRTSTRVVNGVVMNAGGGGRFQYGRGHRGGGRGGGYGNNANYRGGDNFHSRRDENGDDFNNMRDDGDSFNRRNDGENFNRRNRNEYSGGRGGRGPPPQGNGYHHHNGNGFHQPRPFPNENGRYARANGGPKQTPVGS
ncbi:nuclear transport factor 2 isoform X1 [Lolium perenne]|uniref:nuclear transport factor 2 isoform X1 n=1 Tax=Lolium perenne TaxID=4522 RepID=UPI0021F5F8AB|nr:nuclear transport factor 2-like isoform X1 [Lolium perenne]XP_051227887.1 nuclear transport factor 2-like isoform X1 [Lolium perenne]